MRHPPGLAWQDGGRIVRRFWRLRLPGTRFKPTGRSWATRGRGMSDEPGGDTMAESPAPAQRENWYGAVRRAACRSTGAAARLVAFTAAAFWQPSPLLTLAL